MVEPLHQYGDPLPTSEILKLLHVRNADDLGVHTNVIRTLRSNRGRDSLEDLCREQTQGYIGLIADFAEEHYHIPRSYLQRYAPVVIPSAFFHAETLTLEGRTRVVVHSGLFAWLSFMMELNVLQLAFVESSEHDDTARRVVNFFSKTAIDLSYSYLLKPFVLPRLSGKLTNEMKLFVGPMLLSAELFVILHEISHATLGHLYASRVSGTTIKDVFVVPEQPSLAKQQEFEADISALDCISEAELPGMLHSVAFFLARIAMCENWAGLGDGGHPLTLNRLENIIASVGKRVEQAQVDALKDLSKTVLEDYESSFRLQSINREFLSRVDVEKQIAFLLAITETAIRTLIV